MELHISHPAYTMLDLLYHRNTLASSSTVFFTGINSCLIDVSIYTCGWIEAHISRISLILKQNTIHYVPQQYIPCWKYTPVCLQGRGEVNETYNSQEHNWYSNLPRSSAFSVYFTSNELPSRDPRNKYPSPHSHTYRKISFFYYWLCGCQEGQKSATTVFPENMLSFLHTLKIGHFPNRTYLLDGKVIVPDRWGSQVKNPTRSAPWPNKLIENL